MRANKLTLAHPVALLIVPLILCSCKTEGEQIVDRLAQIAQEASVLAHQGESEAERGEAALAAMNYLKDTAVEVRILESHLDDVVRTLNASQRQELIDYARQRLSLLPPGLTR